MNENQTNINTIFDKAVALVKNPVAFYRGMPKRGGYLDPVLYLVVMAALAGLIISFYFLFGFGVVGGPAAGVGTILMTVVTSLVGSFVGAAILFVVWKLMGSNESFETAYRCTAYASVTYPFSAILGPIPYFGSMIIMLYGFYLLSIASVEVHGLEPRKVQIVFGILAALVVISNLSTEIALRRMASNAETFSERLNGFEELDAMNPEQAGKAVGQFVNGFDAARKTSGGN